VVTDPDAPPRTFTHWVAYGIPPTVRVLPGGLPGAPDLRRPVRLRQGRNDAGTTGYAGPCPPAGGPHRYVFALMALRAPVRLAPAADRAALERAVRGRVLAPSEPHRPLRSLSAVSLSEWSPAYPGP
jgi:Raf kinase inhibitor-like YbhB/YbcL family protein